MRRAALHDPGDWIRWVCPGCRAVLLEGPPLRCPECGNRFQEQTGIFRFLSPQRRAELAGFIRDYQTIRKREGRTLTPAAYRSLPEVGAASQRASEWRIRRASFASFRGLLQEWQSQSPGVLCACDLGAGNCWLSNRMALEGVRVAAVDILTNAFDGLGCHENYDSRFVCVEADFDRLPFESSQFDLAIFNASLHYSVDYGSTLRECMRILRPEGRIAILDSPVYEDPESGEQMVRERETSFLDSYGIRSNLLKSRNFLTRRDLDELESSLGLRWELVQPSYPLGWRIKKWRETIFGRREPAKFFVIVATRQEAGLPPS